MKMNMIRGARPKTFYVPGAETQWLAQRPAPSKRTAAGWPADRHSLDRRRCGATIGFCGPEGTVRQRRFNRAVRPI